MATNATGENLLQDAAPNIRRPRYRPQCPLLWRGPDRLQIGEGTHHVILTEVDAGMAGWLLRLDGLRTLDEVAADLPIPVTDATRLLQACLKAGAVEDAAAMPDAWRWADLATRDAARGDHQAAASTYGSSHLADLAIDRRSGVRWWVRGNGFLSEQVRMTLALAGLPLARTTSAATVIVLADSIHPVGFEDPAIPIPHLPIGVYGDRAIVGPMVVPNETSCLQCAYLHTRDADPQWPSLSLQLHRSISSLECQPIDRLHALLAAAQAALLIRCWADAPGGRTWRNRAIEIRLPEGTRTEHERPWHPLCSCRWDARASATAFFG